MSGLEVVDVYDTCRSISGNNRSFQITRMWLYMFNIKSESSLEFYRVKECIMWLVCVCVCLLK